MVIGGLQHRAATSFTPAKIDKYEATKAYREQGIVWVCPTRGQVHTNVAVSWVSMQWPMNQFRSPLIATEGMEVAVAYNVLIRAAMDRNRLRKVYVRDFADAFADAPFILTCEEDNVLPGDTVPRLMTTMFKCPDCGDEVKLNGKCVNGHRGYDAVSGLYWLKSDPPMPMAFGTPNGSYRHLDFKPRSVSAAVKNGTVIEVNGIAMGCALWRKSLFKRVSRPWFRTTPTNTQDLYFCTKAKREAHARFAVDCGLHVGHYQPGTKELF